MTSRMKAKRLSHQGATSFHSGKGIDDETSDQAAANTVEEASTGDVFAGTTEETNHNNMVTAAPNNKDNIGNI